MIRDKIDLMRNFEHRNEVAIYALRVGGYLSLALTGVLSIFGLPAAFIVLTIPAVGYLWASYLIVSATVAAWGAWSGSLHVERVGLWLLGASIAIWAGVNLWSVGHDSLGFERAALLMALDLMLALRYRLLLSDMYSQAGMRRNLGGHKDTDLTTTQIAVRDFYIDKGEES